MKASNHFKQAIQAYLDQCALFDELFREKYTNEKKNIDECVQFRLNTIQKSGINGFADNEVFGMAIHYYQEDNIDAGKPITCKVVVNRTIDLTAEEKEQIRKDAIEKVHSEAYNRMKQPIKKIAMKTQITASTQLSMF